MSCEGSRKEHLRARSRRKTARNLGSFFIGQREKGWGETAAEDGGLESHVQVAHSHLHLIKPPGRHDVMRRFSTSSSDGGP